MTLTSIAVLISGGATCLYLGWEARRAKGCLWEAIGIGLQLAGVALVAIAVAGVATRTF